MVTKTTKTSLTSPSDDSKGRYHYDAFDLLKQQLRQAGVATEKIEEIDQYLERKLQEAKPSDTMIKKYMESVQSRTDIANLLERGNKEEVQPKIMSQVIRTLELATTKPSVKQLLQRYRGLVHILQIIDKSPNGEISTRKLLETINSGDLHKLIKKAEILGFIKREKVKNPKGKKGNNIVMNSLTPMGRTLLEISLKYYYSPDDDRGGGRRA